MSGIITSFIFVSFVNPNNEKCLDVDSEKIYSKNVVDRMQYGFNILCIYTGICGCLGSLLLVPKKN